MRKVVTGILALCMVSAMMAETVMAAPDTVKGDVNGDGVLNTKDIVLMKKYLLGEATDIDADGADMNGDQKINVADMIYLTGILTEAVQPPQDPAEPKDPEPENPKEPKDPAEQKDPEENKDKTDTAAISEMNKTAKDIYETAVRAQLYLSYLNLEQKVAKFNVFNNEDSNELTDLMKQELELPDGTRWSIAISDCDVRGCICTSGGVTGAYPNEIPMSVNVDYDKILEANVQYYSNVNINWKDAYPEWVSADETIKDYVPKTTNELNSTAETLFTVIKTMQQEAETAGKPEIAPLNYTGITADEEIEKQYRDKIFALTNLSPQNTTFALSFSDGELVGCICTDSYGKVTGAYPNTVPQTMNIPYKFDNAKISGDISFDWKQTYPQYISDDPAQSSLPDYPEKTVAQYNDFAKTVFTNAQTIIQEKETLGETVPNGFYTEENELFANIGGAKGKYFIFVKNGMVIYCLASSGELTRSGAYPAGIPQNMDIPFDVLKEKMPPDADDFKPDWKIMFPDYVSATGTPDNLVSSVSFFNDAAKNIFTNVQTMLQEYEISGKEVPNGIYTSESELFRELASDEYEFSVKIESYEVRGAAAGCEKRSGAYPASVPQLLNVPFDNNLADIALRPDTDWFALYPDALMDFKTFSAEIGNAYTPNIRYLVRKSSVDSANANAKSVFTTAMVVAMECEAKGEVIDGIFNSSDISSDFVQSIKRDLPPRVGDWAVKVKNNEVVGACTTATYGYTGAYPNYVPKDCIVDYDGYKELCEENHKSDEWETVGFKLTP